MTTSFGPWLPPLTRARVAAEQHMAVFERMGDSWKEETVTDLVLANAWPEVKWASFTRNQEAQTGADWMWWWRDRSGTCFGMLIQAKRLKWTRAGSPTIDFFYKRGTQRRALQDAARLLGVPAMYALYLGTPATAREAYCRDLPSHDPNRRCDRCHRTSLSLYASTLVTFGARTKTTRSRRALERAFPLEDVASFRAWSWAPTNAVGAARTAQAVAQQLTDHIIAGLTTATAPQAPPTVVPDTYIDGWLHTHDDATDSEPSDERIDEADHDPYLNVEDGLRDKLPSWVERVLDQPSGDRPNVPESLAGVIVVDLPN